MAFFKRDKSEERAYEILTKYQKGTSPFALLTCKNYDGKLLQMTVIAHYLKDSDIKVLTAILEANKGKENNPKFDENYKELTKLLNYSIHDLGEVEKFVSNAEAKVEAIKSKKKKGNLEEAKVELKVAEKNLIECKERHNKLESYKNFIDQIEKHSLDKHDISHFKKAINELSKLSKEIHELYSSGDSLYGNYKAFWGEDKENIEKLEQKQIKGIIEFEKMVDKFYELAEKIPRQYEVLDEFLESHSPETSYKL